MDLTQSELAIRVELSRTSITNIERGKQHISLHMLYVLSDAISVEPSQLLPQKGLINNSLLNDVKKALDKIPIADESKEHVKRLLSRSIKKEDMS